MTTSRRANRNSGAFTDAGPHSHGEQNLQKQKDRRIRELVKVFERNILKVYELGVFARAGEANRYTRRYCRAFDKLRSFGDEGREALVPLMSHQNPHVRISTAVYLLRYCTEQATSVLKQESQGKGMLGWVSREALKRWEEGTWQLDPED